MPRLSHEERALKTLDRMDGIVEAEALVTGQYELVDAMVDEGILTPSKAKRAPCGGNKFCAVGSLYFAGGVKIGEDGYLPGTGTDVRDEFLAERPHIKIAYDALNQEAYLYARDVLVERGVIEDWQIEDLQERASGAMEALFEGFYDERDPTETTQLTNDDLRTIIARAKGRITA